MSKYKKRADGRYLIQVLTGYNADGKPRYKNVYARTIRELEEKAARVRDELDKGVVPTDTHMTVGQWARKWLELYKSGVAGNTRKAYEWVIAGYITPNIGVYKLRDLKPRHVQELLNAIVAEGKQKTAEKVASALKQIFARAVRNEYIYKNPMDAVDFKRRDSAPKRALTDDEIRLIQSADMPPKEKMFAALLINTGLRRGEALALTRNDIDMTARTISVSKSVIMDDGKAALKSPKTPAGNRAVPITDDLFFRLSAYLPTLSGLYVFPGSDGGVMTINAFDAMWDRILRAVNLAAGGANGRFKVWAIAADITPHLCRHTYATLLHRAGVDVKTAQYLLGHASVQVTLEIYTHLDESAKTEQSVKFNSLMNSVIQSEISQLGDRKS